MNNSTALVISFRIALAIALGFALVVVIPGRQPKPSAVINTTYRTSAFIWVTFGTDGTIEIDSGDVSVTQKGIDPFILRNLERNFKFKQPL